MPKKELPKDPGYVSPGTRSENGFVDANGDKNLLWNSFVYGGGHGGLPTELVQHIASFLDLYTLYLLFRLREQFVAYDKRHAADKDDAIVTLEFAWVTTLFASWDPRMMIGDGVMYNTALSHLPDKVREPLSIKALFSSLFKFSNDKVFKKPKSNKEWHQWLARTSLGEIPQPISLTPFSITGEKDKREGLINSYQLGQWIANSPEFRERLWRHNPEFVKLRPLVVVKKPHYLQLALEDIVSRIYDGNLIFTQAKMFDKKRVPLRAVLLALIGADIDYLLDEHSRLVPMLTLAEIKNKLRAKYFSNVWGRQIFNSYDLSLVEIFPTMTHALKLILGEPYSHKKSGMILVEEVPEQDSTPKAKFYIACLAHADPEEILTLYAPSNIYHLDDNNPVVHYNFDERYSNDPDSFRTMYCFESANCYFLHKAFFERYLRMLTDTFLSIVKHGTPVQKQNMKKFLSEISSKLKLNSKFLSDEQCILFYNFLNQFEQYEAVYPIKSHLGNSVWTKRRNHSSMRLYYLGRQLSKLPNELQLPLVIVAECALGVIKTERIPIYIDILEKLDHSLLFEVNTNEEMLRILLTVVCNNTAHDPVRLSLCVFMMRYIDNTLLHKALLKQLGQYVDTWIERERPKKYNKVLHELNAIQSKRKIFTDRPMEFYRTRVWQYKVSNLRTHFNILLLLYELLPKQFDMVTEKYLFNVRYLSMFMGNALIEYFPMIKQRREDRLALLNLINTLSDRQFVFYQDYILLLFLPNYLEFVARIVEVPDLNNHYVAEFKKCLSSSIRNFRSPPVIDKSSLIEDDYNFIEMVLKAILGKANSIENDNKSPDAYRHLIQLYLSCLKEMALYIVSIKTQDGLVNQGIIVQVLQQMLSAKFLELFESMDKATFLLLFDSDSDAIKSELVSLLFLMFPFGVELEVIDEHALNLNGIAVFSEVNDTVKRNIPQGDLVLINEAILIQSLNDWIDVMKSSMEKANSEPGENNSSESEQLSIRDGAENPVVSAGIFSNTAQLTVEASTSNHAPMTDEEEDTMSTKFAVAPSASSPAPNIDNNDENAANPSGLLMII